MRQRVQSTWKRVSIWVVFLTVAVSTVALSQYRILCELRAEDSPSSHSHSSDHAHDSEHPEGESDTCCDSVSNFEVALAPITYESPEVYLSEWIRYVRIVSFPIEISFARFRTLAGLLNGPPSLFSNHIPTTVLRV